MNRTAEYRAAFADGDRWSLQEAVDWITSPKAER
jgi:hypothetical protein